MSVFLCLYLFQFSNVLSECSHHGITRKRTQLRSQFLYRVYSYMPVLDSTYTNNSFFPSFHCILAPSSLSLLPLFLIFRHATSRQHNSQLQWNDRTNAVGKITSIAGKLILRALAQIARGYVRRKKKMLSIAARSRSCPQSYTCKCGWHEFALELITLGP